MLAKRKQRCFSLFASIHILLFMEGTMLLQPNHILLNHNDSYHYGSTEYDSAVGALFLP